MKSSQRLKKKPSPQEWAIPNPMGLLAELKAIAVEADQTRLSFMIDAFSKEHPELYEFISGLVDDSPQEAMNKLSLRWPALKSVPLFLPQYPQIISAIQKQIKQRRDEA